MRDRRVTAVTELFRVLKPGGVLLASVMSRYGATTNVVCRGETAVLSDPLGASLRGVVATGDLPPFASRGGGLMHPAMHLYTAAELCALIASHADVVELAGSNVSTFEGNPRFEEVAADAQIWGTAVQVERSLACQSGLVDTGSHIIVVARAKKTADASSADLQ